MASPEAVKEAAKWAAAPSWDILSQGAFWEFERKYEKYWARVGPKMMVHPVHLCGEAVRWGVRLKAREWDLEAQLKLKPELWFDHVRVTVFRTRQSEAIEKLEQLSMKPGRLNMHTVGQYAASFGVMVMSVQQAEDMGHKDHGDSADSNAKPFSAKKAVTKAFIKGVFPAQLRRELELRREEFSSWEDAAAALVVILEDNTQYPMAEMRLQEAYNAENVSIKKQQAVRSGNKPQQQTGGNGGNRKPSSTNDNTKSEGKSEEGTCWKCGSKEHQKKQCPEWLAAQKKRQAEARANAVQEADEGTYLFRTRGVLSAAGKEADVSVMIDSGCFGVIVSTALLKKWDLSSAEITPCDKQITVASGATVHAASTLATATLAVSVGGVYRKVADTLYVVNSELQEILLGGKTIHDLGFTADWKHLLEPPPTTWYTGASTQQVNFAATPVARRQHDNLHDILEPRAAWDQQVGEVYCGAESTRRVVEQYASVFDDRMKAASVEPVSLMVQEKCPAAIWTRQYNLPPPIKGKVQREIDSMIRQGVLKEAESPHNSVVVPVPKANSDELRITVNFKPLNRFIETPQVSMPCNEDIQSTLHGMQIFGAGDLRSYYHQIPLDEESQKFTAITVGRKQYVYKRLPMGVSSAPFIAHTMMSRILGPVQVEDTDGNVVAGTMIFLDDVLLYATGQVEFDELLGRVLCTLVDKGFTLKAAKCNFGVPSVSFLGLVVSAKGLSISPDRMDALEDMARPTTPKMLKSFLGRTGFVRTFIPHYSTMIAPLQDLLKGGSKAWKWSEQTEAAYDNVLKAVRTSGVRAFCDYKKPLCMITDAGNDGAAAMLFQFDAQGKRVLGFASKAWNETERKWTTFEHELAAILIGLNRFDSLVWGAPVIHVYSDNRNLSYLQNAPKTSRKLARWRLKLDEYNVVISHVAGKLNELSDYMSRNFKQEFAHTPGDGEPEAVKQPQEDVEEGTNVHNAEPWDVVADMIVDKLHAAAVFGRPSGPAASERSETSGALAVMESNGEKESEDSIHISPKHAEWLTQAHNAFVGHDGVQETLRKLRVAGHKWPGMVQETKVFVKKCGICQKLTTGSPEMAMRAKSIAVYEPFEEICLDTFGPLPQQADSKNRYVVVIIDTFTRFVWMYPTESTTAHSAARALLEHCCLFGVPHRVKTDGGTQYTGAIFTAMANLCGAAHTLSWPRRPQSNGVVERHIGLILRALKATVWDTKLVDHWETVLPLVARHHNFTPTEGIGCAPAKILFGSRLTLDRMLLKDFQPSAGQSMEVSDYMAELERLQSAVIEAAQDQQQQVVNKRAQRLSADVVDFFQVGDLVYIYAKPRHKLASQWQGPVQIATCHSDSRYTVRFLNEEQRTLPMHIENMRKYYQDGIRSPEDMAMLDTPEFIVEDILKHKCPSRRKSTWTFLVKWMGFPMASDDTWEPYQHIKDTLAYQRYKVDFPELNR